MRDVGRCRPPARTKGITAACPPCPTAPTPLPFLCQISRDWSRPGLLRLGI